MAPEDADAPTARPAEELGVEPEQLARSSVGLGARGEGERPRFELIIERPDGLDHVPVPDRFASDDPPRVNVAELVAWLGLPADQVAHLPAMASGERQGDEDDGEREWGIREADDEDEPLGLGAFAGWEPDSASLRPPSLPTPEEGDVSFAETGGAAPPAPRPAVGDTDSWPQDVDGWLAAIDAIEDEWHGTLRAGDVRAIYGGRDDEVLLDRKAVETGEDGEAVVVHHLLDEDGNPVDEEFTDAVDDRLVHVRPVED